MSYITFQQQCNGCRRTWNAAFGIVGTAIIAQPPEECPYCKSKSLTHFADGWAMNDVPNTTLGHAAPCADGLLDWGAGRRTMQSTVQENRGPSDGEAPLPVPGEDWVVELIGRK